MKINGKPDGGGGGIITGLTATNNGTYNAPAGIDGYNPVTVALPLDDYATKAWVSDQGYIDSSDLSTALSNYVESSDPAVEPLFNRTTGYLKNYTYTLDVTAGFIDQGTQFFDQYGQCYVWNIGGEVYGINFLTPELDEYNEPHIYIYKFNRTTNSFEHLLIPETEDWVELTEFGSETRFPISAVTDPHFLWEDLNGRVYYSNIYEVDLQYGEFREVNEGGTMGGTVYSYNGQKNNIVKLGGTYAGIYMLPQHTGIVYKFNESTRMFESSGYVGGTPGVTNWYRYGFDYEGTFYTIVSAAGGIKMYKVEATQSGVVWSTVTGANRPFPITIGTSSFLGDRVHKIVKDNVTTYVVVLASGIYKLVNGSWVEMTYDYTSEFTYNTNGAECDDFMLGYGYNNDVSGEIPLWDFSTGISLESYGWDDTVDTRLDVIEANLGEALNISNNILS